MTYGIKINDVHSGNYPLLIRTSRRPIMPAQRLQYEEIPGRDGAYDYSDGSLQDLILPIDCSLITLDVRDLRYWIGQLAVWIYGGGKKVKIIFDDEPDVFYYGRISNQIDPEQLATIGEFTLQFRCDPVKYFYQDAATPDLDDETILGREVRDIDEYSFTVTTDTIVEVNNFGTHPVSPVIEVTGDFTTLAITTDGKTLNCSESISNQTLLIDNDRMTAKIGSTNKLSKTSGIWVELLVGINNVSISGTGLNCTVSFIFKPRFL